MDIREPASRILLIGIPQIAEVADVGPSAVGNWRKRHADFPTPKVQAPSGALFDLDEVERWLIENGKVARRIPASVRLWALADSARGTWQPLQFTFFCIAILVYLEACDPSAFWDLKPAIVPTGASWASVRQESDPETFTRSLQHAAQVLEDLNPEINGLLTPVFGQLHQADGDIARDIAISLDDASRDSAARSDPLGAATTHRVLALRTPRSDLAANVLANLLDIDRFSAEYYTPDDIANLVCRLVETGGGTIFDPAVGEGGLLLTAGLRRHNDNNPMKLVGIEKNEAIRRVARSRCYLNGISAEIYSGDTLRMDLSRLPKADSVVLDPPYGTSEWADARVYMDPRWIFGPPPPSRADFAWVQVAVRQLKVSGSAGVILPAGALSSGGREADIRQAMLDAGVIEGIVLLPPRLRTDTSMQLAVWLLRSPESHKPADFVLLINASDLAKPGRSQFLLEQQTINRLSDLVETWRTRREIDPVNSNIAVTVPCSSIFNGELDPRRYERRPNSDVEGMQNRVQELRGKVSADLTRVNVALKKLGEYLGKVEP